MVNSLMLASMKRIAGFIAGWPSGRILQMNRYLIVPRYEIELDFVERWLAQEWDGVP